MTNTVGLLDLKIAQLEYRLDLLEKQQTLSRNYPVHLLQLQQQAQQMQLQLDQLRQERSEMFWYPVMYSIEVRADELYHR